MIDLAPDHMAEVRQILAARVPDCEVRAFGSRVTGQAWRFSDLDLALVADHPIPWDRLDTLKDAFSESDLPFLVDVIDWATTKPYFRKIIDRHFEVIQQGSR